MENRSKELLLRTRRETLHMTLVLASRWCSEDEIIETVNASLSGLENYEDIMYSRTTSPNSHTLCPAIWKDALELNNNPDFANAIIIHKNNMYKIANKKEAEEYAQHLFVKGKRLMNRYSQIMKKIQVDETSRFNQEGNLEVVYTIGGINYAK